MKRKTLRGKLVLLVMVVLAGVVACTVPGWAANDREALGAAVSEKNKAEVERLLKVGVPVDAPDQHLTTVLMAACANGDLEMASFLLAKGADPRAEDLDGMTPLMISSIWYSKEIVDILLGAGVDVNQRNRHGNTALLMAVESSKEDAVKHLLGKKADPNIRNNDGEVALDRVGNFGEEIRDALGKHGAKAAELKPIQPLPVKRPTVLPADFSLSHGWGAVHADWGRTQYTLDASGTLRVSKTRGMVRPGDSGAEERTVQIPPAKMLDVYWAFLKYDFANMRQDITNYSIRDGSSEFWFLTVGGKFKRVTCMNSSSRRLACISDEITTIFSSVEPDWFDVKMKAPAVEPATKVAPGKGTPAATPLEEGMKAYDAGDFARALEILEPLDRQNDPLAQAYLGVMYWSGYGVEVDRNKSGALYRKAFEPLQKLVAAGNSDAMFRLGILYETGDAVATDTRKALEMMRKSAFRGNARAQSHLGVMLTDSRFGRPDLDAARKWLRKAAEQNFTKAFYYLGKVYRDGCGVPVDKAIAWMYFNHSRQLPMSARMIPDLEATMSPEELEKAKTLKPEDIK